MPSSAQKQLDFTKILEKLANASENDGWWNHEVGDRLVWEGDRYQAAFTGLFLNAARNKKKLLEFDVSRLRFKSDDKPVKEKIKEFVDEFRGLKFLELYESVEFESGQQYELIFSDNTTIIQILVDNVKRETSVEVRASSFDPGVIKSVKEIAEKYLSKPSVQDLFVVINGEDGLELVSIGRPGAELTRENYSDEVIDAFDYVTDQFSSDEPFGRLVIVHGPAGTGKTHMMKAFIEEIDTETGKYIFLPAEFLLKHGMAQITKLLLDATRDGSSLTLIIEDADECLVERQNDNMSAISSLLNFADGFIGNMLNVRIIATTNAGSLDIDPAVKRNGRLCKIIKVDLLSPNHANTLFKTLVSGKCEGAFTKHVSLADVYAAAYKELGTAKDSGVVPSKGAGFSK